MTNISKFSFTFFFVFISILTFRSYAYPNQEIINNEEFGGFLEGIIIIILLALIGYPILFFINFIRLTKVNGFSSAKARIHSCTNKSFEEYMQIAIMSILFVVPMSLIPVGIFIFIISFLLILMEKSQFQRNILQILIAYFCISNCIAIIYAIYKGLRIVSDDLKENGR